METGVLGPLRVRADGIDVAVAGRRERCVLATLALHAGQVVSTATLLDHVWGDDPPRTAIKSLQTAMSNLRRIMRDIATEGWLETSGSGYRLNVPHERVDLGVFEAHVAVGRAELSGGSPEVASQHLTDALAQWRGDTPADLGDGLAADIESNRLVELRLDAQADRIDAELHCVTNASWLSWVHFATGGRFASGSTSSSCSPSTESAARPMPWPRTSAFVRPLSTRASSRARRYVASSAASSNTTRLSISSPRSTRPGRRATPGASEARSSGVTRRFGRSTRRSAPGMS